MGVPTGEKKRRLKTKAECSRLMQGKDSWDWLSAHHKEKEGAAQLFKRFYELEGCR